MVALSSIHVRTVVLHREVPLWYTFGHAGGYTEGAAGCTFTLMYTFAVVVLSCSAVCGCESRVAVGDLVIR